MEVMNTLIVLIGPTAVGKTDTSLAIADYFSCPIISSDSRQMYQGMEIGTAMPTKEERERCKHYFLGQLKPGDYYSAAKYEQEVLQLTSELFKTHNTLILSGGSMMYIDAVCNGIDDIPTVDEEVRATLAKRLQEEGLEKLLAELRLTDPEHYDFVDHKNAKRVVHALEVCYTTGKPYSSFLTRKTLRCGASTTQTADRPFRILKIGLERPREELFARINSRVDDMIPDADIVVVFGGTNDFGHGDIPFGTLGDNTKYTFYGGLDYLIKRSYDEGHTIALHSYTHNYGKIYNVLGPIAYAMLLLDDRKM